MGASHSDLAVPCSTDIQLCLWALKSRTSLIFRFEAYDSDNGLEFRVQG